MKVGRIFFDLVAGDIIENNRLNDTVIRKFVRILANTKNDSVFATEHVRILVDYLWGKYYYAILVWVFLPYLLFFMFFGSFLTFFQFSEVRDDRTKQ